jgi:hypothetical protein
VATFVARLKKALSPTDAEVVELALRETDRDAYDQFTPIAGGPVLAVAGLVAVGVLAAIVTPFRIVRGLRRGPRT